jgi:hypothetical protein
MDVRTVRSLLSRGHLNQCMDKWLKSKVVGVNALIAFGGMHKRGGFMV